MTTKNEMLKKIEERKAKERSAWRKGVCDYAYELIEELEVEILPSKELKPLLLNGADDWTQYSYGGSSLIYNGDIAERLSNKTELRLTNNGQKEPNKNETWLDVQARALYQAYKLIISLNC